jgi:hypothetical protein
MSALDEKIEKFLIDNNSYRVPLEKIINIMRKTCTYINGESLERHNWGNKPKKLKYIPDIIKVQEETKSENKIESEIIKVLEKNETENIDSSIIELLWGDIQLGKRVQACIIMWFSVHIFRRPVLYVFRNLKIDQNQLCDDIIGTNDFSFNVRFIKNIFIEFNDMEDIWKKYTLPDIVPISNNNIINKLNNKDAIKPDDIFCCLMNIHQLDKINDKFNDYIIKSEELVNITLLIDESDLMSPTSSNNKNNKKDFNDTSDCEKILAKIYKKVKYILHITGTAHSLLYNITTCLSENTTVTLKVSKVHKMIRSNDYYGLFNHNIHFETELIKPWWERKPDQTKDKYKIITDYDNNIKKIINKIIERPLDRYNSFLISEEKEKKYQSKLTTKILEDFDNLFVIIYNGGEYKKDNGGLILYLSKNYVEELKKQALKISKTKDSINEKIYDAIGGICGTPKDYDKDNNIIPNNYCYYDIDTTIINIKQIYHLLRFFFEKSEIKLKYKTVITITGKYAERGYSFTSIDYDKFSFHLTDQYFVSHATFNCTDISQRLRLQGKYNDNDLKNGTSKLTLWTTKKLTDVINFYVNFIKKIEENIMVCNNWIDIKDSIENILDNGELEYPLYMKYIDVLKKRKNLKITNRYDKKIKGCKIMKYIGMNKQEIRDYCKVNNLPEYNCINKIKECNIDEFKNNKFLQPGVPMKVTLRNIDIIKSDKYTRVDNDNKNEFINYIIDDLPTEFKNYELKYKSIVNEYNTKYRIDKFKECIENSKPFKPDSNCEKMGDYAIIIIGNDIKEFDSIKGDAYIIYYTDKEIIKDNNNVSYNPVKYENIFLSDNETIKYSVIRNKYNIKDKTLFDIDNNEIKNYYWKSPDGYLWLYSEEQIKSIEIIV